MTMKQPQILEQGGKPAFAVLPIEEYEAIRQRLEDLEDIALLAEAEANPGNDVGRSLEDVLRDLGLANTQSA